MFQIAAENAVYAVIVLSSSLNVSPGMKSL